MSDHDIFNIEKALDTGSVSTGAVLIPEVVEEGFRMFVETRSPLWNMIDRPRMEGYAYAYREQNSLPTAAFGAELANLPSPTESTWADRAVPVKSIYTTGEISGQLIAATRTVIDIVRKSINDHSLGLVRTLEQKIVTANSSVNPLEFDGLDKWITNTLYLDSNGDGTGTDGELTLAALDEALDIPQGSRPTVWIFGLAMRRKLWSMLQPQMRYTTNEVPGGFTVPTYAGLPIIEIFDSHGTLLDNRIYAPDMNMVKMPVLQDIVYEQKNSTRDSFYYMLKMYLTFVVEGAARHHVKIVGADNAIV